MVTTRIAAALAVVAVCGCAREPDRTAANDAWLDSARAIVDTAIARQQVEIDNLMTFRPDSVRCLRVGLVRWVMHDGGSTWSLFHATNGRFYRVAGRVEIGDSLCGATQLVR